MDYITTIGIIGGILTSFAMLPQVIKAVKTKDTRDLSAYMVILMTGGLAL